MRLEEHRRWVLTLDEEESSWITGNPTHLAEKLKGFCDQLGMCAPEDALVIDSNGGLWRLDRENGAPVFGTFEDGWDVNYFDIQVF